MDRYKKMPILLLGLSFLFSACLNLKQPGKKIEFYTLEYDPPKIAGLKSLPLVIRVERFSVAPTYNTSQIIYRDGSFKRNAYVYYRWRANPGHLVTQFLNRDIKQSGLFKAVLSHESTFPSSYMLEGSVDEFFEWDMEEEWHGILSVSVTLVEENEPDISKRILFQKTYRTRKACNQKNPGALAEAMSRAMAQVSEKIMKDIYYCLKDRNREDLGDG